MSCFRKLVWNDRITVYHRGEAEDSYGRPKTVWTRTVYEDCFFNRVQTLSVSGNTFVTGERYVVRIPAECCPVISPEDLVVRGNIEQEAGNPVRLSEIKTKYKGMCFTVEDVTDDTKLTETAHVKVTGS